MYFPNLKSHTLGVLRNCNLMGGKYTETADGPNKDKVTYFVRCIPYENGQGTSSSRDLTPERRTQIVLECIADLKSVSYDQGCILSNNLDFFGDYLRVEHGSRAYWLICHMKS